MWKLIEINYMVSHYKIIKSHVKDINDGIKGYLGEVVSDACINKLHTIQYSI